MMDLNFNTLEIQEGKLGKTFRQVGVRRNGQVEPKWIDRVQKYHWIYLFKYVEDGRFFEVEVNYYNKIIKVNKNV